jgi:hypothetical protein
MTGSPRFLGSPLDCMPCSQISAGRRHQAIRCLTCCLPPYLRRRLPRQLDVETQSHSLQPRCLRFAARVTPAPRKTRFRLAANLDRMGLDTHRTPKMVSVIQFIHPPSPSFPSAQAVQAAAWTTRTHSATIPLPRHPINTWPVKTTCVVPSFRRLFREYAPRPSGRSRRRLSAIAGRPA